ncbi:hypothetical protein ACHAWF_002333 [Thalassiosira exigua]
MYLQCIRVEENTDIDDSSSPLVSNMLLSPTFILALLTLAKKNAVDARATPRNCHAYSKHVHLAVGRDPAREMTVSFATEWSMPGISAPVGGVHVGLSPDRLDRFVPEQEYPLQYNETLPNRGGMYHAPFQHHITIDGLEPGTTYYYRVVKGKRSKGVEGLVHESMHHEQQEVEDTGRRGLRHDPPYDGSTKACPDYEHEVRHFTTAPETKDGPVSFGIIGDLGQFQYSKQTLEHMERRKSGIDAVMLVGDIAYTELDHRRWDTFFDFLDDYSIFSEVPVQIATGNHDIDKLEHGNQIFLAYETRFRMPQVHPAQLGNYECPGKLGMDQPHYPLPYEWGNAYYSFVYGPAKHIVVSAYSNMDPGSPQYNWLVEEFESVDRAATPWVLVTIHTPIYNSFYKHFKDPQIFAAREHLEPLFVKYHVNVIFAGHIHAYQRTKNVAMGRVDPKGPVHLTIGASGRDCNVEYRNETAEEWIETRDASYFGWGKFTVMNKTHARWKWMRTSLSDDHPKNTVHNKVELSLPSLMSDEVVVENQFFLE